MADKPEALQLADELDGISLADMTEAMADEAAAELRRLHAVNAELTENLEKKSGAIQRIWKERDELRKVNAELLAALKLARSIIGHPDDAHSKLIAAAIAKAEGRQ